MKTLLVLSLLATPLAAQSPDTTGRYRDASGRPIPGKAQEVTVYDHPEPKDFVSKIPVSVKKLPDGSCDWRSLGNPIPKGFGATMAKRDDRTCTGTIYVVPPPRNLPYSANVDSAIAIPPRPDTMTIMILDGPRGAVVETTTTKGRPKP